MGIKDLLSRHEDVPHLVRLSVTGDLVNNVKQLQVFETVRVDPTCIEDLVALVGDREAARRVGTTFDDLGDTLAAMTAAWRAGDAERVVAEARTLIAPTGQIGLKAIQRVAIDVVHTGVSGDGAAFAATFSRLVRLAEEALTVAFPAGERVPDPLDPGA
ncbi:hypothetical protein [Roseitranquillus sediminis]|uniref:hypothetical protein n=1 Tax=Roseitranquillus sediminis TaxID=2809051 RepID=UPI001D0BFD15|nr:hypothetical protein [Roseitranquillus sediminis]MBM9593227.1 hypothetical protein [Roseitranquillus sediminis]